jgi:hypothetical protein
LVEKGITELPNANEQIIRGFAVLFGKSRHCDRELETEDEKWWGSVCESSGELSSDALMSNAVS